MKGWHGWAGAVAAAFVCGCGGGGGGGGGDDGGGGGVSRLIPAAPALGAVIHADAAVLRPRRDGALYKYQGGFTPYAGATPTVYTTETTQGGPAGAGAEALTNTDNIGVASRVVTVAAGVVSTNVTFNFTGVDEPVTLVELRSPVRANDQYTLLDRHYPSIGFDIDGDGKNDPLDVAMYARVVGSSTLAFRNLPSVEAVEVHTFIVVRITASSNGQSEVSQGVQKRWYAAGIGIVRNATDLPNETGLGRVLTDDSLVSWDGLTEGFGAMPPRQATVPPEAVAELGSTALSWNILAQFAFPDHMLLVTSGNHPGAAFSTLDLRGNVVAAHVQPGLNVYGRFTAWNGGIALVTMPDGALSTVTRFDAHGVLQGAVGAVSLDLGGGRLSPQIDRIEVAGDGATLWVLWARRYVELGVGFRGELVLRAFDPQGAPITSEMILEGSPSFGLAGGVAARDGRALVSWGMSSDGGATVEARYAVVTPLDAAPAARMLAGGLPNIGILPISLMLDTGGAFLWSWSTGSNGGLPSTAGIRLDAAFQPLRSTAGPLDAELLSGTPVFGNALPSAAGNRIVVSATVRGTLWPELPVDEYLDVVAMLDAGAAPLSAAPARVTRTASTGVQGPRAQLVYPDRVILFGSTGGPLMTTVVWLR